MSEIMSGLDLTMTPPETLKTSMRCSSRKANLKMKLVAHKTVCVCARARACLHAQSDTETTRYSLSW